jgi:hypothetical protein
MYYMIQVLYKLVLAYLITCIGFGFIHSIYFVQTHKEKIFQTDEIIKRNSSKPLFVLLMYMFAGALITWQYMCGPVAFYKSLVNK